MTDKDFAPLFKYMDNEFSSIRAEYSKLRQQVDSYFNLADSYIKQTEIFSQEMMVLSHQVDRSEDWIKKISSKIGIKLTY